MSSIAGNIDVLAGLFNKYFSGASNIRMASILLLLLAFVLFLFLIIVLYVKSIIAFLKTETVSSKKQKIEEDFSDDWDDEEDDDIYNERELEKELERELARDLEQSRLEKESQEMQKRHLLDQKRELERQEQRRKESEKEKEKEKQTEQRQEKKISSKKDFQVDLDWKKGRLPEHEQQAILSAESLSYQQSSKTMPELLGLIIDMLGRGVDDLKIAQTVMYRNQGRCSEDEIMQTISAIKDFIALAVKGRFVAIRSGKQLPDEATALYHLAEGDTTYSLALLEALMDSNIERSASMTSGQKRDEIFIETSNQACTFGTLSAISDIHLATGAFELAIELVPKNVNAWSRVGDMYAKVGSHNQAIKAYHTVLDMADEEIHIAQVSNANKMLSQYYYEQGNNLQAAKLYNSSKQYYDSLGINRRLDRQELEIIEIIESRQHDELGDTINKILNSREMQYGYA